MGRFSVQLYVRPSVCPPPLGHPARPEAQPARPGAQPTRPEAQPARPEARPARPEAQPARPEAQSAIHAFGLLIILYNPLFLDGGRACDAFNAWTSCARMRVAEDAVSP